MKKLFFASLTLLITLHGNLSAFAESTNNPLKPFVRPEVIFTFDDVYQSVYDYALPILKQENMPATAYVAIKWANDQDPTYMKWPALKEVHEKYGWEIAGHTVNHPVLENESAQTIESEVKGSKEALEQHGFHPVSFAVPYGSYNNTVLTIIQKYFENNRGFWTGDPFDRDELRNWLNLSIKQVANTTTVSEIKGWVDQAVLESKKLILVFHIIDPQSPASDRWGFGVDQFREIANYVAALKKSGVLDVPTIEKSLSNKGKKIEFDSTPTAVNMDLSKDEGRWFTTPTFSVQSDKAYLVMIHGEAWDFSIDSRYELMVEEFNQNGEKKLLHFLTSEPESLILAKTYLPSSTQIVKARLAWKISKGGPGIMKWNGFEIYERSPLKK